MNENLHTGTNLERLAKRALMVGGAALALCVVGALFDRDAFFRAYLVGFMMVAAVPLGCLALFMLHNMSGGGWGFVIRRVLEAGSRTFPVLLLLFIPLVFGMHALYEWSHDDLVAADALLQHKSAYLNRPFFLMRAAMYFLTWIVLAHFLNRWSAQQDADVTEGAGVIRRMQYLSGAGLMLYGLTMTFAAVDWVMSLEPHWFSTIYGLKFIVGQSLAALCFSVLVLRLLSRYKPLAGITRPSHFQDLGNLILTFVVLWAYIAYSQYLIIWSGNLPEENIWYLRRTGGGWQFLALFLIGFHFAVPFLILLSRKIKRQADTLSRLALALLVMRLLDLIWLIKPAFTHPGQGGAVTPHFAVHWLDFAAPLALGGIWLWAFLRELRKRPLMPAGDPRLQEVLAHAPSH